jgi:hypothetical protein
MDGAAPRVEDVQVGERSADIDGDADGPVAAGVHALIQIQLERPRASTGQGSISIGSRAT